MGNYRQWVFFKQSVMKDTYFGKILRVVESLPTTQFPKKTSKGTDMKKGDRYICKKQRLDFYGTTVCKYVEETGIREKINFPSLCAIFLKPRQKRKSSLNPIEVLLFPCLSKKTLIHLPPPSSPLPCICARLTLVSSSSLCCS